MNNLEKIAKKYEGRRRAETQIPQEVIDTLVQLHKRYGRFVVPVKDLHEAIGSRAKTTQREALRRKLNRQCQIAGKEWYVGVATQGGQKAYIIDIREKREK